MIYTDEEKDEMLFYDDKFSNKLKSKVRKEIAKECELAIENEIDMISGPVDEDDYVGFRQLQTAFENIMKIVRGEQ